MVKTQRHRQHCTNLPLVCTYKMRMKHQLNVTLKSHIQDTPLICMQILENLTIFEI